MSHTYLPLYRPADFKITYTLSYGLARRSITFSSSATDCSYERWTQGVTYTHSCAITAAELDTLYSTVRSAQIDRATRVPAIAPCFGEGGITVTTIVQGQSYSVTDSPCAHYLLLGRPAWIHLLAILEGQITNIDSDAGEFPDRTDVRDVGDVIK